jgi:membrane protease YdiL (CAAX protease family)
MQHQGNSSEKVPIPTGVYIEFVCLFVIIPILYATDLIIIPKVIPLIALFMYCLAILIVHRRHSSGWLKLQANWKLILIRFVLINIAVMAALVVFSSHPLVADFNSNPKLLVMVLLYPFFSALPQELIFREFFFYRYQDLFRKPKILVAVNVVLFAFAHLYFMNWIVIVFTLVGGALFAITYQQTRSLLVVTLEHSIYGLVILSSGLWEYFYKAF